MQIKQNFLFFYSILIVGANLYANSGSSRFSDSSQVFFQTGAHSFLTHSILGSACSASGMMLAEYPCQPAALADLEDHVFSSNLYAGEDYDVLYKNRDLLKGNNKKQLALSLMSEPEPVRLEGSVQLWGRYRNAVLLYQPVRYTYFSRVTNSAYPDVTVHAMQEQSLSFAWGQRLDQSFSGGIQIRGVDRTFIHESFNLFEALPNIDEYLLSQSQKVLYFEPGLVYEFQGLDPDTSWHPALTAKIENFGFADKKYEQIPLKPYLDTGVRIQPPMLMGEFEFLVNYRWIQDVETERKFRLGAQYHFGLATFIGGFDPDQWSVGLNSIFRTISAGLMYKRSVLSDFDGQKLYDDATFLELRVML
ncbi:MAG: hypothetical protein BroJett040_06940 [Oligoflexia bacterium]|nr:MAG: hypothetical protein BroJett040_06940 [Oligoflexia bacterium]